MRRAANDGGPITKHDPQARLALYLGAAGRLLATPRRWTDRLAV